MPISSLSQDEVDEFLSQRLRLAPLAASLGVRYDEHDPRLMNALDVIATAQTKLGLVASDRARSSAPGAQQTHGPMTAVDWAHAELAELDRLKQQRGAGQSPPAAQGDLGDQVVAILKARGRTEPVTLQQAHQATAPASEDLGDEIVRILRGQASRVR